MLSQRRKRSNWHNRRLGTIGGAAVSRYGQSILSSILSRDAPGGSSYNHAHITEEKTEVSKCQEPCLSSTWIAQCLVSQEQQKRRGGLIRPSRLAPSENLEILLGDPHHAHVGSCRHRAVFTLVGEGRGAISSPGSTPSSVPPPPVNADRAGFLASIRALRSHEAEQQILEGPHIDAIIFHVSSSPRPLHTFTFSVRDPTTFVCPLRRCHHRRVARLCLQLGAT